MAGFTGWSGCCGLSSDIRRWLRFVSCSRISTRCRRETRRWSERGYVTWVIIITAQLSRAHVLRVCERLSHRCVSVLQGIILSGGQRQRISVARALYQQTNVVFLVSSDQCWASSSTCPYNTSTFICAFRTTRFQLWTFTSAITSWMKESSSSSGRRRGPSCWSLTNCSIYLMQTGYELLTLCSYFTRRPAWVKLSREFTFTLMH